MEEKDRALFNLINCCYYMLGAMESSGNNASCDFVLESIDKAEALLWKN